MEENKMYMFTMAMTADQLQFLKRGISLAMTEAHIWDEDFYQDVQMAIYCADEVEDY